MNDRHFSKLFVQYHEVDHQVRSLENADQPTTDEHMEDLKKQRLNLKDNLYKMIKMRGKK
jgi:uncharacterized protein YdcH (DUF465 family)